VRSALDNINLMSSVEQGRQEFQDIRGNIETTVSDNINSEGCMWQTRHRRSLYLVWDVAYLACSWVCTIAVLGPQCCGWCSL